MGVRRGLRRRVPRHAHAGRLRRAGRLFGLFKIDPVDDVVHLLSGIAGVVVAAWANRWIAFYLHGSIVLQGPGAADFGVASILINLPHMVLAGLALVIGFRGVR